MNQLPAPRLTYYGDDFTGSTDALESFAKAGLRSMLFLRQPGAAELSRFGALEVVGLAGESRSRPPDWMERELHGALAWLKNLGAPICHYKICSTFDSSPAIGSIGKAIDIGAALFGAETVPVVAGVPQLRRYTAFGTHFAAFRDQIHRLDRHPVMRAHPVTPMSEADLTRVLAAQTARRIANADIPTLAAPDVSARIDALRDAGAQVIVFDTIDAESQAVVGRELVRLAQAKPLFVVGSSGVGYALGAAWSLGDAPSFVSPGARDRIAVVSGSCSATTARQIKAAAAQGFAAIPIDVMSFVEGEREAERVAAAADEALRAGRCIVAYTAEGAPTQNIDEPLRLAIGRRLGALLRRLVAAHGLDRVVIAGGDTSSHAAQELGVLALDVVTPWPGAPGAPLCQAYGSDGRPLFEIALKGGQLGGDDYFAEVRAGRPL